MEQKIFDGLKQTFSGKYGVSDEVIRGYAKSLASTGLVTEENLATVIQGQEHALRAYQSNFDRIRKESHDYKKELDELKAKRGEPGGEGGNNLPKEGESMPEWGRTLIESLSGMATHIGSMKQEFEAQKKAAEQADIRNKVVAGLKGKNATDEYVLNATLRGVVFDTSKTVDQLVEDFIPAYDKEFSACRGNGAIPRKGVESSSETKKSALSALKERHIKNGDLPGEK